MTRLRRVAAACAVTVGVLAAPSSASADTGVLEVGWWTNSPFAQAPAGGVAIGNAPNGPSTVAALRLQVGRGVTSASIRLQATGGFAQEIAAIKVCRGADGWTAEAGGDLADAPAATCGTTTIPLDEGESDVWTADVISLVGDAAGTATVMLLPTATGDPTGSLGLGWEVRFEAPQFSGTEAGAGHDTPTAPPATPTSAPVTPPRSSSPTVSPGASRRAAPAPPTTMAPTTVPEPQTPADEGLAAVTGAPGVDDEGRPWARLGGYVVLAGLIGAAAGAGRWLLDSGVAGRLRLPFR